MTKVCVNIPQDTVKNLKISIFKQQKCLWMYHTETEMWVNLTWQTVWVQRNVHTINWFIYGNFPCAVVAIHSWPGNPICVIRSQESSLHANKQAAISQTELSTKHSTHTFNHLNYVITLTSPKYIFVIISCLKAHRCHSKTRKGNEVGD